MNLLYIVVQTANILGIFTDPFEFEGDYGSEINPTRQQVFELVVSREALAKNLSDSQILMLMEQNNATEQGTSDYRKFLVTQAINQEKEYGPVLSELVTPELIEAIKKKQIELIGSVFTDSDFNEILSFIAKYKDKKVFRFLRNNPSELLSLDKILRDKAAREGKIFDLPILGSTKSLTGKNSLDLKLDLIDALFTKETLALTKCQNPIKQSLEKLDQDYLKSFFGETATNQDLLRFSSRAGQVFFYWMYHALNLHLIAVNPEMIEQVNKVKHVFASTLGNPAARANALRMKLIASDSGVLFTQESDALMPQTLIEDGLFLPISHQNPKDGTFVLLRSDLWEPDYEVISIAGYDGFNEGKLNVVLAKSKGSDQRFLLASCHGHSTKSEDGRLQISLIMEKFRQLSDGKLQLLIGTDANTKTEEDVELFREHLDALGLTATQAGPTTVKKRMVTAQHSKAGRFAIDEEDYLITLKPENGGQFQFNHVTVGFKEEKVDINKPLPNIDNPSDHYPVGASLYGMVDDRNSNG